MIANEEHCSSSNPRSRDDSGWGLNSGGSAGATRMKKWVAPICYCGSHAILFMSGTVKNPDRLFFRCPKFKTGKWHCNFFAWLDDYVSSCGEDANKAVSFGASKQKQNRLEGHGYVVDNKVNELEERLIGLEDQLDYCRLKMGESRCIRYGLNLLEFLGGIVITSLFRASV
ncbi:hypothetical protein Ahy_A02g008789 [Arachis hypogaea]|uniref:GRF-type domain-containing protein n=1 Tax=Arachis hypogaea TaxID=3818 RepID=A0A445EFS8_ARAHY|nr:hypothetical protein Ahy_A02g008789 [Arachis hypogaea]